MKTHYPARARRALAGRRAIPDGFTLVELLAVVAIISLLIALLVPAVNGVRNHAKAVSSQNLMSVLGKGCEMFNKDFNRYPRSNGRNPFETNEVGLSGAQWLILELAGADLKGYVAMTDGRQYDSQPAPTGDGQVNAPDWLDWYSLTPSQSFHRFGPYIQVDAKAIQSPAYFRENTSPTGTLPEILDPDKNVGGASDWKNGRLAFAVDAFGSPVLYYAANDQAADPFSQPTGGPQDGPTYGRYTQWDNAPFTGSASGTPIFGEQPGIDLGGGKVATGPDIYHWLYYLGWPGSDPSQRPPDKTFAGVVYDRALFDQTKQSSGGKETGKVWPRRPDTFFFISAGKDGIYGTSDDVTSF